MDNFNLKKYLAEGKLLKENKYDIDDPNSPLGQLNDNDQDVAILNNMTKKYGKDVVLMWMSSGEYGDREYFEEGKLLKEAVMWNWDGDRNSLEEVPSEFKAAVKAVIGDELDGDTFEEAFDGIKNFHADEAGEGEQTFNSDHWAEQIEMDYL